MADIVFLMTNANVPQTSPAADPEVTIYRADAGGGNSLVVTGLGGGYDLTYEVSGVLGAFDLGTDVFNSSQAAKIFVNGTISVFRVAVQDTANANQWTMSTYSTHPSTWVDGEVYAGTSDTVLAVASEIQDTYAVPSSGDAEVSYTAGTAEVLASTAMSHVGGGIWAYEFLDGVAPLNYVYLIDADPSATGQVTAPERYFYGTIGAGDIQNLALLPPIEVNTAGLATNVDAILVDTGTTLPAQIQLTDNKVATVLDDTAVMQPLISTNLDAVVSTLALATDLATVDLNVDAILVDTGTTLPATLSTIDGNVDSILVDTGTTIPAQISGLENLSAAEAGDAVWDEARAGHATAGTFGEFTGAEAMRGTDSANTTVPMAAATSQTEHDATQSAIAGLTTPPTAGAIADAVWDEATAGHATAGTFAVVATDTLTDTAAIDTVTATNLDATVSSRASAADLATMQTDVDAVLVDTGTTIPAQITALENLSAAAAADAVWDELRSGHTTAGTAGQALTHLLNGTVSRQVIDITTSPWQLNVYVFAEGSASDSVVHELYDLYDQDGAAIAGDDTAGNNPLNDSTRLIAERRRV